MQNVLLAVQNPQQSNKFKKILTSRGYQVIAAVDNSYTALRILQNRKGAISLITPELQGLNGLQLAQIIADEGLGPVILVSQYALEPGINLPKSIFGVLVKPITEYQLLNTTSLAVAQYENQKKLENEVAQLKDTIESRKLVEKAKGILMQKHGISEEAAYSRLRKNSMEKRITMKKLAEAIITLEDCEC